MTYTMGIIDLGLPDNIFYIEAVKIKQATYTDFFNCNWDYEAMGLFIVDKNKEGKNLFIGLDFEGEKTWEEIKEIGTEWFKVSYHDGNNHKTDVFEHYRIEEMTIKRNVPEEPNPCSYFCYDLIKKDGEVIKTTVSNQSGSLSPYYIVEKKQEV